MWIALGLAAATLVSEDATAVGAGVLARSGGIAAPVATLAVALGIWAGDVALYAAGRLARRWPRLGGWIDRRWPAPELQRLAARLDRGAAIAILASRMLPGSRLPLYLAAGIFRVRATVFVACTAVAASAWTAVIVMGLSWRW